MNNYCARLNRICYLPLFSRPDTPLSYKPSTASVHRNFAAGSPYLLPRFPSPFAKAPMPRDFRRGFPRPFTTAPVPRVFVAGLPCPFATAPVPRDFVAGFPLPFPPTPLPFRQTLPATFPSRALTAAAAGFLFLFFCFFSFFLCNACFPPMFVKLVFSGRLRAR